MNRTNELLKGCGRKIKVFYRGEIGWCNKNHLCSICKAELKGRQDVLKEVKEYLDNNCFTREDILKFKEQLNKEGKE